jgi:hypothetical protein
VQFCRNCVLWFTFHFTPLVERWFFVWLIFFGVCGVLFNVLSRNVFPFFHRGSPDETVLRSVNFGACTARVLSMSYFLYSIFVYAECRHIQIFVVTWNFNLVLGTFCKALYVCGIFNYFYIINIVLQWIHLYILLIFYPQRFSIVSVFAVIILREI